VLIIASVEDPVVIGRILAHLRPRAQARGDGAAHSSALREARLAFLSGRLRL